MIKCPFVFRVRWWAMVVGLALWAILAQRGEMGAGVDPVPLDWFGNVEVATPWVWLGLAAATLVSEDLTCIGAGLLVAQGQLGFVFATTGCFAGIFVGDMLLVLLGRGLGLAFFSRPWLARWVDRGATERARKWVTANAGRAGFVSRFLPGTRLPTYLAAGIWQVPWGRFVGWFLLACALWTPILVGLAAVLGESLEPWWQRAGAAVPVLGLAVLWAWAAIQLLTLSLSWRGRRLLWSRWRRLVGWEFWPTWAIYPPVVAQAAWHALTQGSLTWFTAVNPGIGAGGGLVGESKSEILRGLAGAGARIARWHLIPTGPVEARLAELDAWQQAQGLGWPLVLKPDRGQRGRGVIIARDRATARGKLATDNQPMVAQAYVPGVEFGVFYMRRPDAPAGRIFAITDKRSLAVIGDGKVTLEHLILAHPRAVCMAPFFLEHFTARLDEVPGEGEEVELAELGTHSRGAIFLEGKNLVTLPLAAAVDGVSRQLAGFYYGRYDVRTASAAALQRGEFVVIELNGVTSEATNMYDPAHGAFRGWRILLAQWREAAIIAAINRRNGVRALRLRELAELLAKARVAE